MNRIFVFLFLLLVSCSNQEVDPFLVGDDNCKIPCWNLITPGLTTRTDAINRVETLQYKENYNFTESDIYLIYNAKRVHIHLNETNQIVESITIEFNNTSLGQIDDLFGEPEYLSFQFDSGGCTSLFYYPKIGSYFTGQCKSDMLGEHWKVSRNTIIVQGLFTSPNLEDERLFVLLVGDASKRLKNNIRKWEGYQSYPTNP